MVVAALGLIGLVGCSTTPSTPPAAMDLLLPASAVDLEFSREVHETTVLHDACLIPNYLQRVDGLDAARAEFTRGKGDFAPKWTQRVVVSSDGQQTFDGLVDLLQKCGTESSGSSDGSIAILLERTYDTISGPEVADQSYWFTVTGSIKSTTATKFDDTLVVFGLFRVGDAVMLIDAPAFDSPLEAQVAFIEDHAGRAASWAAEQG